MNHVKYVKENKSDFSEYIFGDSEYYLTLTKEALLVYMMKYSSEFYNYKRRKNELKKLLDD